MEGGQEVLAHLRIKHERERKQNGDECDHDHRLAQAETQDGIFEQGFQATDKTPVGMSVTVIIRFHFEQERAQHRNGCQ